MVEIDQVTSNVRPVESSPIESQKQNTYSSKYLFLSLLVVLVVFTLIGGAYFFSVQKKVSTIATIPSITPIAPTVINTEYNTNEEIYKNSETGMTFKYPTQWKVIEEKTNATIKVTVTSPSQMKLSIFLGPAGVGGGCNIDPQADMGYEPIAVFGKALSLFFVGNKAANTITYAYLLDGNVQCPNIAYVDISDKKVKFNSIPMDLSQVVISATNQTPQKVSDFKSTDFATAQMILKNITFTNNSPTNSTVNWPTFTSEYGFMFQYPPQWKFESAESFESNEVFKNVVLKNNKLFVGFSVYKDTIEHRKIFLNGGDAGFSAKSTILEQELQGRTVLKADYTGYEYNPITNKNEERSKAYYVLIPVGSYVVLIAGVPEAKPEIESVIQTFTFTK